MTSIFLPYSQFIHFFIISRNFFLVIWVYLDKLKLLYRCFPWFNWFVTYFKQAQHFFKHLIFHTFNFYPLFLYSTKSTLNWTAKNKLESFFSIGNSVSYNPIQFVKMHGIKKNLKFRTQCILSYLKHTKLFGTFQALF